MQNNLKELHIRIWSICWHSAWYRWCKNVLHSLQKLVSM